jgi:hypothetical protein
VSKGVKLKKTTEQKAPRLEAVNVNPPPMGDIYESVVRDKGFDPLKEMAARRT